MGASLKKALRATYEIRKPFWLWVPTGMVISTLFGVQVSGLITPLLGPLIVGPPLEDGIERFWLSLELLYILLHNPYMWFMEFGIFLWVFRLRNREFVGHYFVLRLVTAVFILALVSGPIITLVMIFGAQIVTATEVCPQGHASFVCQWMTVTYVFGLALSAMYSITLFQLGIIGLSAAGLFPIFVLKHKCA